MIRNNVMDNTTIALDALKKTITRVAALSEANWELFTSYLIVEDIKKRKFLLKEGDFCNAVYFIQKGYCRLFKNNEDREVNLNFYFENEFVTNIKSYQNKTRSDYSIQAGEDMAVIKIIKSKVMENLGNSSMEFEIFARKMLEHITVQQQDHAELFKLFSPAERYQFIEKNRPEILQRIPLIHVASFLGVTRETLTRIRKKEIEKMRKKSH
jgi:CRP-like cAMP-binding protein